MSLNFLLKTLLLLCALVAGNSSLWADTDTYIFSSKKWEATLNGSAANWTSGRDGNWIENTKDVQITTNVNVNGANATSPKTFEKVSKIVITYRTNQSTGQGSIKIQIGNNIAKELFITKEGGTSYRTLEFNINPEESGKVKFTVNCTENSINIKSIAITYNPTVAVTITDAKYATFSYNRALDFSETEITVYKAKANGTSVTLTEIEDGVVPANTGVILYCETAGTYTIPLTTTENVIFDNELVGTTERTLIAKTGGAGYNYILQSNGNGGIVFYMATEEGAFMPANRAYLSTNVDVSANGARLSVSFGGETTGITEIENGSLNIENAIYNLKGQRIDKSQLSSPNSQIIIMNGKKVIRK